HLHTLHSFPTGRSSDLSVQQLSNSSLTYTPPRGPPSSQNPTGLPTVASFRFTLRSDMFFQDGRKVTAFDVAFSYLALKASGAFADRKSTRLNSSHVSIS